MLILLLHLLYCILHSNAAKAEAKYMKYYIMTYDIVKGQDL